MLTPDWSKWHYTEGNGFFTACGRSVVPFIVDGSPQEANLAKINCRACRAKIRPFAELLAKIEAGTATPDDVLTDWQRAYRYEVARASNSSAEFLPQTGGWFLLRVTGDTGSKAELKVRKRQVEEMTEQLRSRPDHVPQWMAAEEPADEEEEG